MFASRFAREGREQPADLDRRIGCTSLELRQCKRVSFDLLPHLRACE